MTPARNLGDVQGQRAHPVDVGDHLDGAHDRAQIPGHRRLQRQQHERAFLGSSTQHRDLLVVGEHLLGLHQIGLQQCLRCVLHGQPGQPAHLAELVGQLGELLMVCGTHGV